MPTFLPILKMTETFVSGRQRITQSWSKLSFSYRGRKTASRGIRIVQQIREVRYTLLFRLFSLTSLYRRIDNLDKEVRMGAALML